MIRGITQIARQTQEDILADLLANAPTAEVRDCTRQYNPKNTNKQHKPAPGICLKSATRTTRMPAFWGYPRHPMITHTIDSYWIPSQNKTKSNLQI